MVRLILYCSCILFFGCKSSYESKYSASNRFIKNFNYNYYNDSLKISIDFFSDYNPSAFYAADDNKQNIINNYDFSKYKKIIQKAYPKLTLTKKNFVFKSSTSVEPFIHSALFYISEAYNKSDTIVYDRDNNILLLSKQDGERLFIQIFNLDKQYRNNNLFDLLQEEAFDIFATFAINNNYKKTYPANPFEDAAKMMGDSANYLSSIKVLDLIKWNYKTPREKNMWLQATLVYNSFIQNNPNFKYNLSQFYLPKDTIIKSILYDKEALSYIIKETKNRQLILINEQHWQPKHRFLGNMLLKTLYNSGFRYLAVEAISKEDESMLNRRKYPLQKSGFYTKDPVFGNFIRNALNMGFEIISYDESEESREYSQAKIIYEKTFKKDPKAKVFVWCGITHLFENESELPRMAFYLKKLSGIDPLTIEHTFGDVKSKFLKDHYLSISSDTTRREQCDIFIYNNIRESDFEIIPYSDTRKVEISLSDEIRKKLEQHGKLLLMVYNKNEFELHRFDAVPILNYLLENNGTPIIQLPIGEYILIKRSPTGFVIEQNDLIIN